jgi:hypothetical protein
MIRVCKFRWVALFDVLNIIFSERSTMKYLKYSLIVDTRHIFYIIFAEGVEKKPLGKNFNCIAELKIIF